MASGGSSRRQVIGYGVAVAAAIGGVAGLNDARRHAGGHAGRRRPVRQPAELPQPRMLRSVGRELSVRLTARPALVDLGAPRQVATFSYDGVLPGHTWEVRPGDTLRVHL